MDLIVVRGVGCCSLMPVFLDMESGTHVQDSNCEYIKVKALRLVPDKLNTPYADPRCNATSRHSSRLRCVLCTGKALLE
jgi:hypothetical protein